MFEKKLIGAGLLFVFVLLMGCTRESPQTSFAVKGASGPDLLVFSIAPNSSSVYVGQVVRVTALIKNVGTKVAGVSVTRFASDGGNVDAATPSIGAGMSQAVVSDYRCMQSGSHPISVYADFFNNVSETNESNNLMKYTVHCLPIPTPTPTVPAVTPTPIPSTLPDLKVDKIYANVDPLPVGIPATVYIVTKNIGNKNSSTSKTQFSADTFDWLISIAPLAPGANQTSSRLYTCPSAGQHLFTGRADVNQTNNESNESNNVLPVFLTCSSGIATPTPSVNATPSPSGNVTPTPSGNATPSPSVLPTPTPTPVGPQPELHMAQLVYGKRDPWVGDTFEISIATRNQGNGMAGTSHTRLTVGGGVSLYEIPQLAPGKNATNSTTYTCTQPGLVTVTISIDDLKEVSELNENNNYLTDTFRCYPAGTLLADLEIYSMDAQFLGTDANGRKYGFTYTVYNHGDAPATNFRDSFHFIQDNTYQSFFVPSLGVGETVTHYAEHYFPDLSGKTYQVDGFADDLQTVDEKTNTDLYDNILIKLVYT